MIRIVEVGPRDGLQNEATPLSPAQRAGFITDLYAAGLRRIEAGSFVSPKWVPQMAGTAEVLAALDGLDGARLSVLVPNAQGLEAAVAARNVGEIAIFASASEAFSLRNINCTVAQSLARFAPVAAHARAAAVPLRGYISCVLGCPYQGTVAPVDVLEVARGLRALGCAEISLGDTIGCGTPRAARDLLRLLAQEIPITALAVHFHNSYGQALANVYAALEEGVTVVDAAAGGLGGCPYAKGASGNLATEDLVYMLGGMGLESGVALEPLLDAVARIGGVLGQVPRSMVYRAKRLG